MRSLELLPTFLLTVASTSYVPGTPGGDWSTEELLAAKAKLRGLETEYICKSFFLKEKSLKIREFESPFSIYNILVYILLFYSTVIQ